MIAANQQTIFQIVDFQAFENVDGCPKISCNGAKSKLPTKGQTCLLIVATHCHFGLVFDIFDQKKSAPTWDAVFVHSFV